jgi:hypothetical protein
LSYSPSPDTGLLIPSLYPDVDRLKMLDQELRVKQAQFIERIAKLPDRWDLVIRAKPKKG